MQIVVLNKTAVVIADNDLNRVLSDAKSGKLTKGEDLLNYTSKKGSSYGLVNLNESKAADILQQQKAAEEQKEKEKEKEKAIASLIKLGFTREEAIAAAEKKTTTAAKEVKAKK